MMDWKKYFNSTILSRGRQYYHEGRVKRLVHRDHEWFAVVKGSRSYNVIKVIFSIWQMRSSAVRWAVCLR